MSHCTVRLDRASMSEGENYIKELKLLCGYNYAPNPKARECGQKSTGVRLHLVLSWQVMTSGLAFGTFKVKKL